jgi:hypothetical protein
LGVGLGRGFGLGLGLGLPGGGVATGVDTLAGGSKASGGSELGGCGIEGDVAKLSKAAVGDASAEPEAAVPVGASGERCGT